jgi:hypothetical protein
MHPGAHAPGKKNMFCTLKKTQTHIFKYYLHFLKNLAHISLWIEKQIWGKMGATWALKNFMHKHGNKPDVRLAIIFYQKDSLQIIPVKRHFIFMMTRFIPNNT